MVMMMMMMRMMTLMMRMLCPNNPILHILFFPCWFEDQNKEDYSVQNNCATSYFLYCISVLILVFSYIIKKKKLKKMFLFAGCAHFGSRILVINKQRGCISAVVNRAHSTFLLFFTYI